MRVISLLVVKVLAVIGANVAFFWACIEFIIYLVKDKAFNWWSVYSFLICVGLAIALVAYTTFTKVKENKKLLKKMRNIKKPKQSKFRQRLEDAMSKANAE